MGSPPPSKDTVFANEVVSLTERAEQRPKRNSAAMEILIFIKSSSAHYQLGEKENEALRCVLSRTLAVNGAKSGAEIPSAAEGTRSMYGGEGGIRTPDTLSGIAVFKTACFNRSHTSPRVKRELLYPLYDGLVRWTSCWRLSKDPEFGKTLKYPRHCRALLAQLHLATTELRNRLAGSRASG